ncbi:MAG: protein kinase [Anaerolineales bacterium]|nr:protein kinase [Anaerolineales bacterium]
MGTNLCPQCDTPNRGNARFCANCGAALTPLSTSQPIEEASDSISATPLLGRYRIEKELGRGGFGAVYRAWDINLNRPCAVKENLDTSPEAQRQFAREASVLANLSHPNLPRVTDHFTIEGQGQYLVMDFVEGDDLASLMERRQSTASGGKIPLDQALRWVIQVADALAYLHTRHPPVVHRDIKPANIRITPEGQAMLVDFGLVKMYDPHMKTTMGARAVTPGYAPPEQYGRGSTDPRTDIYALGATLYKLITARDPLESVQRMIGKQMTPANQVDASIPDFVSQAIERAMNVEPRQRFQTAEQFKNALSAPQASGYDAAKGYDATQLVRPVAPSTQVVPAPAPGGAPAVSLPRPAAPPLAKAAAPARPRSRLWLVIAAAILVLFGVVLILGIWALDAQQQVVAKTADAEFKATLAERVRTTSTARAGATLTAQSPVEASPTATAAALSGNAAASQMRILFTSSGPDDPEGQTDLYLLEADRSIVRLSDDPRFEQSFEYGRAVSLDGKQLAFYSNSSGSWQIFIIDLISREVRQVTDLPDQARHPAWSPDGEHIAFNSYPESGEGIIWVMDVAALAGEAMLVDGAGAVKLAEAGHNGRPDWSPDGERLLFNGLREDTNGDGQISTDDHWDLFIVNADGSQLRNLTVSPEYNDYIGAWSPDGQWIVYVSARVDTNNDGQIDSEDNGDLYLSHPDGSELSQLTHTPDISETDPEWTLDGTRIIFSVASQEASGLWIINLDGSGLELLLDNYKALSNPTQIP